jgi:hypothetical protein
MPMMTLFLTSRETETHNRLMWPALRYSLSPLVAVASAVTLAVALTGRGIEN